MSETSDIPTGDLIIAKVGSNAITTTLDDGTQAVDPRRVADIASGIHRAQEKGYRVILVTSGAVAGGMHQKHFAKRPGIGENTRLSALSAIGQTQLMSLYAQEFEKYGITVAQGLPTQDDFHREVVSDHMRDTLHDLLGLGCVPILNENDFTSFAEMRFGDNDIIGALVGILCEAKNLVLFTVENGIMSANPHHVPGAELIEEVGDLTPEMFDASQDKSAAGSGGINSKLFVGDLCRYSGIETAITHIDHAPALVDVVEHVVVCSRFLVREKTGMTIEEACEIVGEQTAERDNPFFTMKDRRSTI